MSEGRKKYCSQCGAQISPRAKFCPKCGFEQAPLAKEVVHAFMANKLLILGIVMTSVIPIVALTVLWVWVSPTIRVLPMSDYASMQGLKWDATYPTDYVEFTVKNTGSATLTIIKVQMNGFEATNVTYTSGSATLNSDDTATIKITQSFTSGVKYEFAIYTVSGNKYQIVGTAP